MRIRYTAAMGNDGSWNSRFPENVKAACVNPELALAELDKYESSIDAALAGQSGERPFKAFLKMMWPILEPERPLVDGWVLDVLVDHYEAISRGDIRKLLVNVPPGCMKSILAALFTAWEWGPQRKAHLRYICASYAEKLSLRDNDRCRDVIRSEEYRAAWGDVVKIDPGKDSKGRFQNTCKGWRFATSVEGIGTGERGDRIIFDDPHNIKKVESPKEREGVLHYFAEVLPTRVNNPETAAFLVIMQRTHEGDVSGHILGMELGYEHLCLPMNYETDHPYKSRTSVYFRDPRVVDGEVLWPERFSERYLEQDLKPALRSWGGDYAVAGQLQQRPVARGGNMFKREWWRFYKTSLSGKRIRPAGCYTGPAVDLPAVFDRVIISVDAAFKAVETGSRVSIVVVGTSGPKRFVLENITRHMEFDEACDEIVTFSHKPTCDEDCLRLRSCPTSQIITGGVLYKYPGRETLIEDKANGPAIVRVLGQRVSGLIPVTPQGGKTSRAQAMEPAVKSGHYYLPDGDPTMMDYVGNFASFPAGKYDDEIDATSQAHIHLIGTHEATRASMMGRI